MEVGNKLGYHAIICPTAFLETFMILSKLFHVKNKASIIVGIFNVYLYISYIDGHNVIV